MNKKLHMKKINILNIIKCYQLFSHFNKNLNKWIGIQTIILLLSRLTVALFSLALSNFVNKINQITLFESISIGIISFYTVNRMLEWFLSAIHGRFHTQFILPCALNFIDEIIFLMLKNYHKLKIDKNPVELSHLLNKKTEARGFLGFLFHHISMPIFELIICSILIIKLGFGWLGFLLIPVCIIYLLISILFIPKIKKKILKVLAINAKTTSMFANSLEKANLANTFNTTDILIEELRKETSRETREFKKSALLNDFIATALNLPLSIFACIFFYYGAEKVSLGLASYGGFAAFIGIIMNSFSQLKNLTFAFDGLNQSLSTLQTHMDIYTQLNNVKSEEINKNNFELKSIKFKDFSVIINNKSLTKLNFEIHAGDNLFIVGTSGVGKTSLIKAILGYLPYHGKMLINDEKNININLFSWMPQEFQAIQGSIKFNLLLGNKEATEQQMYDVLEKVGLMSKINQHEGLETLIEHNGNNFSGGENQRLSLARAMLSNNPILILDEPSSSIDMNLEKELFKQIIKMNKTSIIVVHRLKAIPKNATILFIKNQNEYKVENLEFLINNDKEFKELYFSHENI